METVRYVTRDGYFAEMFAPDPAALDAARKRLARMTDGEKLEAAARYIVARYPRAATAAPPRRW